MSAAAASAVTQCGTRPAIGATESSRALRVLSAVIIAAHVPLLLPYFQGLWLAAEHYHFFPFAIVAAVGFTWQRYERGSLRATRGLAAVVALDLLTLTAAVILRSPYLAAFGAALVVVWLLHNSRDRVTQGTLTTVALLVVLVLRPPLNADGELKRALQFVTASISSGVLNWAGINHLRMGVVLELPGIKFFIEEACSGIRSLFTLMFAAALYGVWKRRSLVHTILLTAAAVPWASAANVVRMLAVVAGYSWFGADLSKGWSHEMLGFVTLVLAAGLLLSTDRLIGLVTHEIPVLPDRDSEGPMQVNPLVIVWNRLVEFGSPVASSVVASGRLSSNPRIAWGWKSCVFAAVPFVVLLGLQVPFLLSVPREISFPGGASAATSLIGEAFRAAKVPARLGGRSLTSRRMEEVGAVHSGVWVYGESGPAVYLTLDGAYRGWHDLTDCYRGTGWQPVQHRIREASSTGGQDGADWPFMEVVMRTPTGEFGYLYFSMFKEDGRPLLPPVGGWKAVSRRLQHLWSDSDFATTYGARVFIETVAPLEEGARQQLIDYHLNTRNILRSEALQQRRKAL